jgi:hypothetical protein
MLIGRATGSERGRQKKEKGASKRETHGGGRMRRRGAVVNCANFCFCSAMKWSWAQGGSALV